MKDMASVDNENKMSQADFLKILIAKIEVFSTVKKKIANPSQRNSLF